MIGPEIGRIGRRWQELAATFHADGNAILVALGRLVAAYSAAGRHYHDVRHIDALLALSLEHRGRLSDPVAVDLAILYHDVVYDPMRRDNEEASAACTRQELSALGTSSARIETVAAYIEATKHKGGSAADAGSADSDLDHLLDFDLSILAAVPAIYDEYATAIRREYTIYPDEAYAQGRAGVLRELIAMPALYRVPALSAAWEARARENLARELAGLCPPRATGGSRQ